MQKDARAHLQRPVHPLLLSPAVLLELCPPAAVLLLLPL
jgi:hypothetical protein